jgi:ribosomal protein L11 methylase PrmA
MLGAGRVVACDIDPEAVEVARQHVPAFVGSVDAAASTSADVLLVNIGPTAVIDMAADVRRCLRPGGLALVSGFEAADAAAVRRAYPASALHSKNSWRLLEYSRSQDDGDVPPV